MKFVLLVEGETETEAIAGFLKRWLDPRLAKPIGIRPVNFRGNARLIDGIVAKARSYLDSPEAAEIVAVIGLLDLYGIDVYPSAVISAKDRVEWGVNHFGKLVGRDKFRMFFAVHEFEAWILAQPEVLPPEVRRILPQNISRPETVNFTEPPAKLLNRIYRSATRKDYKKTTYAKQLFRKLEPATVAESCPYLRAMLEELLQLARAAGC